MKDDLRLWILLLVVTSFLAGGAGGVLLGLSMRPPAETPGAFADYEALLVERFDLSEERARGLRVVLDQYQRRVERLKARNDAELEPELAKLGLTFRSVVRDTVLPPDRREEFSRLSEGLLATATPE